MTTDKKVVEIETKIKEAIIATYPEDVFPTPSDVSLLVNNNVAYIMREMAGAVALIARDTIDQALTQHHQDLMSEVVEKLEGMKVKEFHACGFDDDGQSNCPSYCSGVERNKALNTLKKHITTVTGVEKLLDDNK